MGVPDTLPTDVPSLPEVLSPGSLLLTVEALVTSPRGA
jgi:hypothetical protein